MAPQAKFLGKKSSMGGRTNQLIFKIGWEQNPSPQEQNRPLMGGICPTSGLIDQPQTGRVVSPGGGRDIGPGGIFLCCWVYFIDRKLCI